MARSDKPNVVVFFTDQQRADSCGCYGNPMGITPNLDRMAAEGMHLYNAFTNQPVCLPARAVLQTGKYATEVGCHTNGQALPQAETTLAHRFRDAGYSTGYIGKWHLNQCRSEPVAEEDRGGYEYWLAANVLEFVSDDYDCVMFDNDNQRVKLPGYRVDAQTDAAIRFIDAHQEEPFFLFCSYLEPHFQNSRDDYPAPAGYEEQYNNPWIPPDLRSLTGTAPQHLPGYYGIVKRLDEALGRIRDALRSLGLEENTIILFTADHGCHFKTRNSEYKRSCHDSSIRIPMVATGPGFSGGGRRQEMVSLVDVPPTLLDACGIAVPDPMRGRSMLPLARNDGDDWPEEIFAQISEAGVARTVRTRRWKYGVTAPDSNPGRDAHAARYEETHLYDLKADPWELNNLIGMKSHAEVAAVMRERLLRKMAEAQEPEVEIVPAPEKGAGQKTLSPAEVRQ